MIKWKKNNLKCRKLGLPTNEDGINITNINERTIYIQNQKIS